jgi:hypothetical protein
VVGYHVEELGEDVGVILLIWAAAAMTRISRGGCLTLTYAGHAAPLPRRDDHRVRAPAGSR